jgi:8-oxo-dGTP diphosphatase
LIKNSFRFSKHFLTFAVLNGANDNLNMNPTKKKILPVTCAIIVEEGMVLAALRGRQMHQSWKWEFPGGKVEENETPEACIIREIKEELNVEIQIKEELPAVEYHYPEKSIRLIPFICTITSGQVEAVEHEKASWFTPEQLQSLQWAEADTPVLKDFLERHQVFSETH